MLMSQNRIACLLSSTILAIGVAMLPDPARADDAAEPGPLHAHAQDTPEIIVSGRLVAGKADPISAPVVLTGDALTRDLRPQIGDLLSNLPGVTSTGFAPGASRPVLRGFDGPRVQILLDGIGSLDASSVSADHAVSMNTLTVQRIEVLHGPRTLLYASDPAGGVVNAFDKRIPRQVPDAAFKVDAIGSYGTAAEQRMASVATDFRLTDRLVAHFDASAHRSDEMRIGGYAISPGLRADALAQAEALATAGDEEGSLALASAANRRGSIASSWTKGSTLGAGLAFLDTGGDIGVSVQRISSDYGIPPRPSAEAEDVAISMRQTRVDLRAGVNPGGFLKRIELRGAFGDYRHAEIEDGHAGTEFISNSLEARLQADQELRGAWSGSSGASYSSSRLSIKGDERLMPDNHTQRLALFTLQQLAIGNVDLEAALRYENTQIDTIGTNLSRSFNQFSAVAGIAWHPAERVTVSASVLHGERAPSAEELFIDGDHHASQSYQRGNPNFTVERSNGVEAGIRYNGDAFVGSVTAYATNFANFITATPTGEVLHDFPVYQFIQAPARFRGIEAEGALTLARLGESGIVKADAGVDYTHARLVNLGPVPRIPPLRVRGGLTYESSLVDLRGEIEWSAAQRRVSANELPTDAYTLVNLSATWRPFGETGPLSIVLAADNLFNVNGRLATSDTRDFTPISGRDFRLTAKFSY